MKKQTYIHSFCIAVRSPLQRTTIVGASSFSLIILSSFRIIRWKKDQYLCYKGITDPTWAFHRTIRFLQYQREIGKIADYWRNSSELCETIKLFGELKEAGCGCGTKKHLLELAGYLLGPKLIFLPVCLKDFGNNRIPYCYIHKT